MDYIENWNQKASWLQNKRVTTLETIQNSFSKRVALLDGTYFSHPWEDAINYNLFMEPKILVPSARSNFCGFDPWFAHTRCRWRYHLWDNISRIYESSSNRVRQITFIEAENQWLLEMSSYERLFLYLWADKMDINRLRILLKQNPHIHDMVWMITKEGAGKIKIGLE